MTTEIELKLRIPRSWVRRLLGHPLFRQARQRARVRLYSIYFDTPSGLLQRQGLALRLRRGATGWEQTLKGKGGAAAGLHRRREWTAVLPGPRLDWGAWDAAELPRCLSRPKIRDRLVQLFASDFLRVSGVVDTPAGAKVEWALDRGRLVAGSSTESLCELELELLEGPVAGIYELALVLHDHFPLRLENRSKAERGYALLDGGTPHPVKAAASPLIPCMDAATGFQAILADTLGQLLANEPGTRLGEEPEYLHQMRVAVRRLRSALNLFGAGLPPAAIGPVIEAVRGLGRDLGAARDWDVFVLGSLAGARAAFADHPGIAVLAAACEEHRRLANQQVRELLESPDYGRLLLRLSAWMAVQPWRQGGDELGRPLDEFAAVVLERCQRRVRKRGRNLAGLTAEERHRLRIAVKKLRYAADFMAPLYPPRQVAAYLRSLSRLQDVFGALNDHATAMRLLENVALELPGAEQQQALGLVWGWIARAAQQELERLPKAWNEFAGIRPFWRRRALEKER